MVAGAPASTLSDVVCMGMILDTLYSITLSIFLSIDKCFGVSITQSPRLNKSYSDGKPKGKDYIMIIKLHSNVILIHCVYVNDILILILRHFCVTFRRKYFGDQPFV